MWEKQTDHLLHRLYIRLRIIVRRRKRVVSIRKTEINQLEISPVVRNEDISAFEIMMNQLALMQVINGIQ